MVIDKPPDAGHFVYAVGRTRLSAYGSGEGAYWVQGTHDNDASIRHRRTMNPACLPAMARAAVRSAISLLPGSAAISWQREAARHSFTVSRDGEIQLLKEHRAASALP